MPSSHSPPPGIASQLRGRIRTGAGINTPSRLPVQSLYPDAAPGNHNLYMVSANIRGLHRAIDQVGYYDQISTLWAQRLWFSESVVLIAIQSGAAVPTVGRN